MCFPIVQAYSFALLASLSHGGVMEAGAFVVDPQVRSYAAERFVKDCLWSRFIRDSGTTND